MLWAHSINFHSSLNGLLIMVSVFSVFFFSFVVGHSLKRVSKGFTVPSVRNEGVATESSKVGSQVIRTNGHLSGWHSLPPWNLGGGDEDPVAAASTNNQVAVRRF